MSRDQHEKNFCCQGKGFRCWRVFVPFCCLILTVLCIFILQPKVLRRVHFIITQRTWINIFTSTQDTEIEFKKQWSRMLKARVDWKGILAPCLGKTKLNNTMAGFGKVNATAGDKSIVTFMDIRPAGQFSRIFFQTRTNDGRTKTIGGDFWTVTLTGTASIAATVFDHRNGTYEILVPLMDPGHYTVHAFVQYSLCGGLKEPPDFWFGYVMSIQLQTDPKIYDASRARMVVDKGVFESGGKEFKIYVPPTYDDIDKRLKAASDISCATNCRLIWNGYGRWVDDKWLPFLQADNHDVMTLLKNRPITEESLYVIGDSVTTQFHNQFDRSIHACKAVFRRCYPDVYHVYPVNLNLKGPENLHSYDTLYGDFQHHFSREMFRDSLKNVFQKRGMKSNNSLILINSAIHYVRVMNFSAYQDMIQIVISQLKDRKQLFDSDARVVWRTTTAVHYKEIYKKSYGIFLNSPRLRLFSAYALSEMCKAGFEILDWYPATAATTTRSRDPVHYNATMFPKFTEVLTWYTITPEPEKRSREICFG